MIAVEDGIGKKKKSCFLTKRNVVADANQTESAVHDAIVVVSGMKWILLVNVLIIHVVVTVVVHVALIVALIVVERRKCDSLIQSRTMILWSSIHIIVLFTLLIQMHL